MATTANKAGLSPVGRAIQKHTGREITGFAVGKTGHAATNSTNGAKFLEELLTNPNSSYAVKNHAVHGQVLNVRLPNGLGAQWTADGQKFIGLLEAYTPK